MAAWPRRNSNMRLRDVRMPLVVKVQAGSVVSRRPFPFLGISSVRHLHFYYSRSRRGRRRRDRRIRTVRS